MPEQPTRAILIAAVLFRACIFVFWEHSNFDSDQAVMGLMAKHIVEGRAFPVFFYGQYYILGVEAWLAAPFFLLAGTSVTALKLPLLAINIAVALLLFRLFSREVGLRPITALAAVSFFALPAAGISARLVAPDGGNVEPFLYVLLLWLLRTRLLWSGLVLGVGFLHREFTLYGFLALIAVDLARGDLFTRAVALRRGATVGVAATVWGIVQVAKQWSSAAGPGTTIADVRGPASNLEELVARSCVDPATVGTGVSGIVSVHWPTLFGTESLRLTDFSIVTAAGTQGGGWGAWLLAVVMAMALAGIVFQTAKTKSVPRNLDACLFLVLTALASVGGYVIGRCGAIDFYYTRYELLSLLGACGLAAWFLATEPARTLRAAWLALLVLWLAFTGLPHMRLWNEYLRHPPEDIRRTLIAHLDARGVRYATSRYWVSYALTFLTGERIIVKSSDFIRIQKYQRVVDAHANEMLRIERDPCPGGEEIMPRVYFCR